MPKMSGYIAFEKIKEINLEAKVIISSGYAEEHINSFIERGAIAFLQKPYSIVELLQ